MKKNKLKLQHLIQLDTLSCDDINILIERANFFKQKIQSRKKIEPILSEYVVTTLFFEPSTRTINSFLLAAKRLSAITLSPDLKYSSTLKGESLIDTVQTFEAMGTDIFIVRHPDNHTPEFIANELHGRAHVINAGDGSNRHPTQALLDLMTIKQHKNDFSQLKIAIVGDILHSRVAHSLVIALEKVGVPELRLVGPKAFVNDALNTQSVHIFHELEAGIKDADIIIALRIQKERLQQEEHINFDDYQKNFCITNDRLKYANKDVIVMHPGPINRHVEISSNVADSKQSTILEQVQNGVAMRMAILDSVVN